MRLLWVVAAMGVGCSTRQESTPTPPAPESELPAPELADVVSVVVTGPLDAPIFAVGIRSEETGCERYADWWEILSDDGELLFRRTLGHSHVDEQPFVRNGGPVQADRDETLWIRAHLHPDGYGGAVFTGSLATGFAETDQHPPLSDVEDAPPQPTGCAF